MDGQGLPALAAVRGDFVAGEEGLQLRAQPCDDWLAVGLVDQVDRLAPVGE